VCVYTEPSLLFVGLHHNHWQETKMTNTTACYKSSKCRPMYTNTTYTKFNIISRSKLLSHWVNYFNGLTKLMFYCITNCLSSRLCAVLRMHVDACCGRITIILIKDSWHIYIYILWSYFISHTECWTWSLIKKTRELPQYKQTLMPVKLTTTWKQSVYLHSTPGIRKNNHTKCKQLLPRPIVWTLSSQT